MFKESDRLFYIQKLDIVEPYAHGKSKDYTEFQKDGESVSKFLNRIGTKTKNLSKIAVECLDQVSDATSESNYDLKFKIHIDGIQKIVRNGETLFCVTKSVEHNNDHSFVVQVFNKDKERSLAIAERALKSALNIYFENEYDFPQHMLMGEMLKQYGEKYIYVDRFFENRSIYASNIMECKRYIIKDDPESFDGDTRIHESDFEEMLEKKKNESDIKLTHIYDDM